MISVIAEHMKSVIAEQLREGYFWVSLPAMMVVPNWKSRGKDLVSPPPKNSLVLGFEVNTVV